MHAESARGAHTFFCYGMNSSFVYAKSIRACARGAFGRVWIYRVGRVDYPCVSGALRDVYNGVETPPFKPYLYTRVRGEKRCTAHFDSFHAGYPYAYE